MPDTNEFGQRVGDVVAGWEPRPAPAPVTLRGRYVTVLPLSSAHYADLYAACCGEDDGDLWTYRTIDRPTSLPGLWMHLAELLDRPDALTFALVPGEGPDAGRAAGIASYTRIEPAHGQVEVSGILLGRSLQRTRAATEALHLLAAHALDDLGYRRVEWKCDALNDASRRAATRLGFTHEGRFRQHLVVKGRRRDTDWYAITDEEWPQVRESHLRWLAPENFDDDGRQRTSLRAR
ncbi:GNAT family N-acetyltransferase [Nocardioides panacisoli]|uniref:GNAT family N-acetyltransferase n=1 Tax=Nocardioides panacisoli TaxID=627624 RepID=UPI001C63505D|nr:GNAT family protein [Nocardioides panacisoli]QYJ04466.1 GNAT family N-acetyltransferase [Nocardioides panacisoli]